MSHVLRTLSLLSLLTVPTTAWAQEIPIHQRGADGRFETQIDRNPTVAGFQRGQVADFQGRIDGLVEMFAAIPAVSQPATPICRRIISFVEDLPRHGVLGAEVGVMTPINFQNGRCNRMTGGGVTVWLNRAAGIIASSHAFVRGAEDGAGDWFLPRFESWSPERFTLAGGVTVLTRPDQPLYRPVSLERYMREKARKDGEGSAASSGGHLARFRAEELPQLRAESAQHLDSMRAWATQAQIAEMRRMHEDGWRVAEEVYARQDAEERGAAVAGRTWTARLDALSSLQREAQTCIDPTTGEPSLQADCGSGDLLWEINPDYFDRSRPSDIQLVVVIADPEPYHGEGEAQNAGRREIIREMNLSAFAPR